MIEAGVTHDVVLDGQGYMLAAGREAYAVEATGLQHAGLVGQNEVMTGSGANGVTPWLRLEWNNWRGVGRWFWDGVRENHSLARVSSPLLNGSGSHRMANSEGLVADLVGLRPLLNGAALGLTPAEYYYSGVTAAAGQNGRAVCFYGGYTYVGMDNALYRVALDSQGNFIALGVVSGWPGLGLVGAISGMVVHNGLLYICQNGQNLSSFDGTSFVNLGYEANLCASYGGVFFVAIGSTLRWLVNGTLWYLRDMGTTITALVEWDGALWIGCEGGLFRAEGKLQPKDPVNNVGTLDYFEIAVEPVFESAPGVVEASYPQAHNFGGMCAFDGWLWFWMAGRVWRGKFEPGGLSGSGLGRFQLEPQQIFGANRGMAVCNGLIVAALHDAGGTTVWVFDPTAGGWWAIERSATRVYLTPFALANCRDGAVCAFVEGGGISRWPLDGSALSGLNTQGFGLAAPNMGGWVLLPQFGPSELARWAGQTEGLPTIARLLRVGVEWDVPASNGAWPNLDTWAGKINFEAQLSTDGGQTWITLRNAQGQTNYAPGVGSFGGNRTDWLVPQGFDELFPASAIGQVGSAAVAPTGWLVQVICTANGALVGPAIRRVWVDFRLNEVQILTGRKWKLVLKGDNLPEAIGLNGQATTLLGMQTCANLWGLWQSGRTVQYFDLDGSGPYNVKLAALSQKRAALGQGLTLQPDWALGLELAEVVE